MKSTCRFLKHIGEFLFLMILILLIFSCRNEINIEAYTELSRIPRMRPDYSGTVIPPNIAPLNFSVQEKGKKYCVLIHSGKGEEIRILSRDSKIIIPAKKWHKLLELNRGSSLFFDVYVMGKDENWERYQRFSNTIALENIDSHMAYRVMKPIYSYWKSIGIYQRNLENYNESVILHGRSFNEGCINCHTFLNNSPDRMFFGVRSVAFGSSTILAEGGEAVKIGAKWGYTSWHPSGKVAVYPAMKVRQFFHSAGMEIRDVVDLDAIMYYYDLEEKKVKTDPLFSDKDRLESYPSWTPDGRFLFFCSASIPWEDRDALPPKDFDKVKYDLRRISYDVETDTWGEPVTVLSSEATGLSVLEPRISPDGRYMLFCMCEYGCFPVFQPSSDLYLMELGTGRYRRLSINSKYSESWHSWSSNSRWISFSSKRLGGFFTRLYISYVDETGKVHKPFILPQKDPLFYDSFAKTFSVPEFITGPVRISDRVLARAVRSTDMIKVDTTTSATPKPSGVPERE
jgi:hypothetical protein